METNDKARFFAMYIDCCESQIESYIPSIHDINKHYNILLYLDKINNSSLLLKPLSLISDEDAMGCGYDDAKEFINHFNRFSISVAEHQYLLSKGFALDWYSPLEDRVISVSEQIQMNWIKLKED